MEVLRTHEKHSDISNTHFCNLYALILVRKHAKPSLVICSIHEHEEDLEYEPLVLVATAHLDHEHEDAQVVEAETLFDLCLSQKLRRDPLVDFAKDDRAMHLIRLLVVC